MLEQSAALPELAIAHHRTTDRLDHLDFSGGRSISPDGRPDDHQRTRSSAEIARLVATAARRAVHRALVPLAGLAARQRPPGLLPLSPPVRRATASRQPRQRQPRGGISLRHRGRGRRGRQEKTTGGRGRRVLHPRHRPPFRRRTRRLRAGPHRHGRLPGSLSHAALRHRHVRPLLRVQLRKLRPPADGRAPSHLRGAPGLRTGGARRHHALSVQHHGRYRVELRLSSARA